MSQSEKAHFYNALKSAGVKFDRHYREYSTAELKQAYEKLTETRPELAAQPEQPTVDQAQAAAAEARAQREPEPQFNPEAMRAAYEAAIAEEAPKVIIPQEMLEHSQPDVQSQVNEQLRRSVQAQRPAPPVAKANPDELPGVRLNQPGGLQPIRTDEQGRVWYQEEVLKPAFPKPRGRRVLKYMDTGTKVERIQNGQYVEEFEVAGDLPSRPAEVKITLPSYQVGIYKDKRFPFLIHTYNGRQGFDLFQVQEYYGGSELVPAEVKRVYVENVLCYDIRTVVRDIQKKYRDLQLQGKA